MLKKILLIVLLLPMSVYAAKKECAVKPSYDISISKESVHIYNKKDDLIILPNGNVILNQKSITPNRALQKKLIQFQKDFRIQLPKLEQQSLDLLLEIKTSFDQAIVNQLSDDSELKSELNKLYKRLVKLLHTAIITEQGNTQFHYENFNNLKKEGQDIGERIFYNVVGGSILHFNFFKNMGAIKEISKNEWKAQKPKLKTFEANICSVITNFDQNYKQILTELNQSTITE